VRLHEQALALDREFGTTFGIAWSLRALADAVLEQGDLKHARTLLEESLALSRSEEHAWGIVRTLASLGDLACEAGEYAQASRLYEESLKRGRRMGQDIAILRCLEGLAQVAVAQGRMERATWLCGAVAALREDKGWPLPPGKRAKHGRTVAAARRALGEEAFEATWARGHALSLEEAITNTLRKDE
jgi:tetratricopeptide (TPR) repeat protein